MWRGHKDGVFRFAAKRWKGSRAPGFEDRGAPPDLPASAGRSGCSPAEPYPPDRWEALWLESKEDQVGSLSDLLVDLKIFLDESESAVEKKGRALRR